MNNAVVKGLAGLLLMSVVLGQSSIDPQDPAFGWDDYKQLKCNEGFNKVQNYCVKCDIEEGKFFDPVTKQCRKCPEGTQINNETKKCQCPCDLPKQVNPDTKVCQCSGSRIFIDSECSCPDSLPLWNGRNCVDCPPGTTFQPKDMQCYYCPEGFQANPLTHVCQPAL